MLQSLKKFLLKWLKLLLLDLSWDAMKTWVGGHIAIIVPTAAISFIAQWMVRNLYTCLNSPFQCIILNHSEILLLIGLVLILLLILINNEKSEKKFIEISKKISAKDEDKSHKISEEVKKEIKSVLAKFYHILTTERKFLGSHQAQALQYFKELTSAFDGISRNPEVVEDENCYRMIDNTRNRAELILVMATNVVSGQERLIGNKITNHDYLQSIEPIFNEFLGHKREIFQHLKRL